MLMPGYEPQNLYSHMERLTQIGKVTIFSLFLFLSGCGIKASPEVLKPPEVEIRRIGDWVYVRSLSGEIRLKDFEKVGSYWRKERREAFCFHVERVGGKSGRFCLGPAMEKKASLQILEENGSVKVTASGFEAYRLYPVKEGLIQLEEGKSFGGVLSLERDYRERCYLLTGLEGSAESPPVGFCVKPKEPPPVEEVEKLEIREGKEKLYLVWSYPKDYREFVLYSEEKEIGRTVGFSFEVPKPEGRRTFRVKVISPLGFESKGLEISYSP
ncbi:MAG: hypothetical protein ABDH29_00235 [Aquificaceae bacterium]